MQKLANEWKESYGASCRVMPGMWLLGLPLKHFGDPIYSLELPAERERGRAGRHASVFSLTTAWLINPLWRVFNT